MRVRVRVRVRVREWRPWRRQAGPRGAGPPRGLPCAEAGARAAHAMGCACYGLRMLARVIGAQHGGVVVA